MGCFTSNIQEILNYFSIAFHKPKKNKFSLCEAIRNKEKLGVLK